jgi:diaminopimelate epimerase
MPSLGFTKYEGLGNDFLVVDAAGDTAVDAERAAKLCDRHFGVGADGVLLVTPPTSSHARARMVLLNADGSRSEMCGNGIRCVALHLARKDGASGVSFVIDTDAGSLLCEVSRDGDAGHVATSLGRGALLGEYRAELEGRVLVFTRVSMGNPHAVTFDAELGDAAIDRAGAAVSGRLPGGANVEFAKLVTPREIELVVWERGVGRTLACGTGAAATIVAAASAGRAPFNQPIAVKLPGGVLEVSVASDSLEVRQRGPARRVFSGEVA